MKSKIKKLFCVQHDYSIPEELDDKEERSRLVLELKPGESISFSRLHRCKKCGKEKMLGSGMISG